ncbi:ATP-binding protein [Colwellia sp. D2M02]|uniref:sensor histidine kinase n=1 Tax=Colwellia sp. D2M02 TaxID=2841562 RepID=UPI001C09A72C|nr:ATP-binding protein [Colwellia sp. D2M02]MBU2894197.1 ATP-binding protein [Colwellia sp. D2M02]
MRQLYLSIIFTVVGSLFFMGWGLDKIVELTESQTNLNHDEPTTLLYRQIIDGLSSDLNALTKTELNSHLDHFEKKYQIRVSLAPSKSIALPKTAIAELSQQGGVLLANDDDQYLLKALTHHPEFLLQLNFPIEQEQDSSFNFVLTLILYLGICGILILWLLPLTRRLYLLNTAAAKIGAGQLEARVATSRFSYIKMLEKSFNRMAAQIEKLVADNKILARSLSHDIRTPMACLRFGIEAAIDSKSIEKKDTYLLRMDTELTRMEDMTSAFLDYASMERHALSLKKQTTDMVMLINSAKNDCQVLAQQKNVTLMFTPIVERVNHSVDYHWFHRALVNLISNAIGYAKTEVLITINSINKQLIITVEDDGKGIEAGKLHIIFTPFVKLDADRSREQGHFGLGLAICTKVMDWHQGSITASNQNNLSGACFSLTLPIT